MLLLGDMLQLKPGALELRENSQYLVDWTPVSLVSVSRSRDFKSGQSNVHIWMPIPRSELREVFAGSTTENKVAVFSDFECSYSELTINQRQKV